MARNHIDGGLLNGKPSFIYLGIDPSLTGFALTAISKDGSLFDTRLCKSQLRGVRRLLDISNWLSGTIKEYVGFGWEVMDCAVEDTVVASHSAVVLGELAATVKLTCHNFLPEPGKFPLRIPPTMVKKYATDKGNAKKNEVLLACYKSWGVEFSDDNMADSYVIARMSAGLTDTQYRVDMVSKLKDPKFRDA